MVKMAGLFVFMLARPLKVSTEESAEWMWWTLLEIEGKSGSFRTDSHGRELAKDGKYYGDEKGRGSLSIWRVRF